MSRLSLLEISHAYVYVYIIFAQLEIIFYHSNSVPVTSRFWEGFFCCMYIIILSKCWFLVTIINSVIVTLS